MGESAVGQKVQAEGELLGLLRLFGPKGRGKKDENKNEKGCFFSDGRFLAKLKGGHGAKGSRGRDKRRFGTYLFSLTVFHQM
jgi:hypothetical protein